MVQLNVAVVGCGEWGRNHARVFDDLPNANLLSVADIDENRAQEIGKKYDVTYYSNPYKMLARNDIEAVSICTPTITHADMAISAIEHGKHVLVEKPMTNTIEEAETLISKARSSGVYLSVGFVERFNPAVEEATKIISSGQIGDVILAHSRRLSRRPLRIGDVGVIKDLAIHDIDVINQFFDEDNLSVFATAGNLAHEFEDYANIMLCYTKNRCGFVETNWLTPKKVRTIKITGTEGLVNVEYITQEIEIENNERIIKPFIANGEPLKRELNNFVSSIIDDRSPKVTGEDGLKALKICDGALRSIKENRRISLNCCEN